MMNRAILGAAALVSLVAAPAAFAQSEGCGPSTRLAVRGELVGIKDRSGKLLVELFAADDDSFLKGDTRSQEHATAIRRLWITPPSDGPVTLCLPVDAPGRYAMLVTHDRDGTPKFSVGKDGLALPGNTRLGRHRPTLPEAQITVAPNAAPLKLQMQYLKGLAGFTPVSN